MEWTPWDAGKCPKCNYRFRRNKADNLEFLLALVYAILLVIIMVIYALYFRDLFDVETFALCLLFAAFFFICLAYAVINLVRYRRDQEENLKALADRIDLICSMLDVVTVGGVLSGILLIRSSVSGESAILSNVGQLLVMTGSVAAFVHAAVTFHYAICPSTLNANYFFPRVYLRGCTARIAAGIRALVFAVLDLLLFTGTGRALFFYYLELIIRRP
jgi:hypothetical protein